LLLPNRLHDDDDFDDDDEALAPPSPEIYDKGDSTPNHQLKPANDPKTRPTVRFFFHADFLEECPKGLSLYIGSESLRSGLNMLFIFSPIPPSLCPFCPGLDH
jgi:hypothetical protein